MRNRTIWRTLDCGHPFADTQDGFHSTTDSIWCARCTNYHRIVNGLECSEPFHVRCRVCRFSRYFGMNEFEAEMSAERHCRLKGHRTVILFAGNIHKEYNASKQESFDDVPPF